MQKAARMRREMLMLTQSPPPGISCHQDEKNKDVIRAQIIGSDGTPYHGGVFDLTVTIPERYPFEPPKVVFKTPIYHPNIDNAGRICLDTLKMPPQGAWKPSLNIGSVLTTVQLLMSEPNPDDPLMTEISSQYKHNRYLFNEKAKKWTKKYAMQLSKPSSQRTLNDDSAMDSSSSSSSSETSDDCNDIFSKKQNLDIFDEPECSGTSSNSRKRNSKFENDTNRKKKS